MMTAAGLAVEERRLLVKTKDLQSRTAALVGVPFDRQTHELLDADLLRHERELEAFHQQLREARGKRDQ
jgi:hypothetical protein